VPLDTELLPNGNFEQGPIIWAQSSDRGLDLIRKLSEVGVTPHSGQWGGVLGILDNEIASIEQRVTVPTGSPTVNFWYLLGSLDTHLGFDFARLLIDGSVVDEFQLYEDVATSVWTLHSVDLGAFAGRIVDLEIQVETDVAEPSTLIVDDVFFDFDGNSGSIFRDGFESGDTSAWSGSVS
jgi:hypothetical protein